MKKKLVPLAFALCLLLTSCSAILNRSYSSVNVHVDKPTTAEDPSILRVENYRELVSAVLYLVSQGIEEGTIQLCDYSGEVSGDLSKACAEVATQDPVGAYAVDYIRHEATRVVSYYEAKLDIHYRRTMEQIHSVVNVTGTGAIRTELQRALHEFDPELVLRVAYFSEDADFITRLLREAYYDTPTTALGMPKAEVNLYPDSGLERVVEILLTYPNRDLRGESTALVRMAEEIVRRYPESENGEETARRIARSLRKQVSYGADGFSNPYDSLMEGKANSEGMALTCRLLWDISEREGKCQVVEGTRQTSDGGETPWFWNIVTLPDGRSLWLDVSRGEDVVCTEGEFFALGYRWEGSFEEIVGNEPLQSKNP